MRRVWLLSRLEAQLLRVDPFPIILLIAMPLVLMAFIADGIVGGPARAIPGIAALFGLFGLQIVGLIFYRDHGWRTWDRFRAGSIHPWEVALGKVVPLAVLFLAQQVVLLTVGWLVFGMPWTGSIAAGALMVLAIVAAEIGLGLALSAFCRTMNQLSAFGNLGALVLAGIGGALAPVSSMPEWAERIAPASPAYWSLRGLRSVIAESGGVGDIAKPFLVLLAFAMVSSALAVWRFRFDETKTFIPAV